MTDPLTVKARKLADDVDRTAILDALVKTSGNVGKAALLLKVARRTLDKRITGLGLRAKVTEIYPRAVRQPREST